MEAERETNMVKKHLKLAEYYTLLEEKNCHIEEHLAPGRQNIRWRNEENDTCMPVSFWYRVINSVLSEPSAGWIEGYNLDRTNCIYLNQLRDSVRRVPNSLFEPILYSDSLVDSVKAELDFEIELTNLIQRMQVFGQDRIHWEQRLFDDCQNLIEEKRLTKSETDVDERLAKLVYISSSFGAARFSASRRLAKIQLTWQMRKEDGLVEFKKFLKTIHGHY